MRSPQRLCVVLSCLIAATSFAQGELGLDLSPESVVKTVVVTPPVLKVTTKQGGFAGFDASKSSDRFDFTGFKKLLPGLQHTLGADKVISYDNTVAALRKDNIGPTLLRTATGIARMAKASNAAWVVFLEVKQDTLTATVFNMLGESSGKTLTVSQGATYTPQKIEELSKLLDHELIELSKPKAEEKPVAVAATPVVAPPPPEEDVSGEVDQEMARERKNRPRGFEADPDHTRVVVAIGAGAQLRNQKVGGTASADLAELQSSAATAMAVYALVNPLQFFGKTANAGYSDLNVELNYRHAFVNAKGASPGLEGQNCGVTDDDLQVKGTWRYKLGGSDSWLPALGLSGGYSQERTLFSACSLPVVSAVYRGIDLQLRVRQPLYRHLVSLDLAAGPRFLLKGPNADQPGFSIGGEAWVEAKPVSVLFVRGGARIFRAQLASNSGDPSLSTTDLRVFLALEAGVFF